MKNLTYLFYFVLLYTIGCSADKPKIPANTMKAVLLDLHLAESYAQHQPKDSLQHQLKNDDSLALYTAQILQWHHVTKNDFSQSMIWYQSHPDQLDSIYKQILSEITILNSKKK